MTTLTAPVTSDHDVTLSVAFTVRVSDLNDGPMDYFVQEIVGEIHVVDDIGEEEEVGSLRAELFNVIELTSAGDLFAAYDSRSSQLTEAYGLLFKEEDVFDLWRSGALSAAGMSEVDDEPVWHLHASSLRIEPHMRGKRLGLRALRLLRQYVARPNLVATAKAYPNDGDDDEVPSPAAIRRLATYYRSDLALGLRPLGPVRNGWLIGDWSQQIDEREGPPRPEPGGPGTASK